MGPMTPVAITPQMAEAALAMAQAIQAVMANPGIVAEADRLKAEQAVLTEKQLDEWTEARKVVAGAAAAKSDIAQREQSLADGRLALQESQQKLIDSRDQFSRDTEALSAQQQRANTREGQINLREKEVQRREQALASNEADYERRRNLMALTEQAIAKRQQEIQRFAAELEPDTVNTQAGG